MFPPETGGSRITLDAPYRCATVVLPTGHVGAAVQQVHNAILVNAVPIPQRYHGKR